MPAMLVTSLRRAAKTAAALRNDGLTKTLGPFPPVSFEYEFLPPRCVFQNRK